MFLLIDWSSSKQQPLGRRDQTILLLVVVVVIVFILVTTWVIRPFAVDEDAGLPSLVGTIWNDVQNNEGVGNIDSG